jgi:hypothetical protein
MGILFWRTGRNFERGYRTKGRRHLHTFSETDSKQNKNVEQIVYLMQRKFRIDIVEKKIKCDQYVIVCLKFLPSTNYICTI